MHTSISRQQLLSDDGHSAGGRGGGVKATTVRAGGCVCAVWTSISLLVVGTSIQAPALVGCRMTCEIWCDAGGYPLNLFYTV